MLPLLFLFIAAVFPILCSGVTTAWLDEKLWLRQFIQENGTIQSELEDAHGRSKVPTYFRLSDLEEKTELEKLGITFPHINSSYPGNIKIHKVHAYLPKSESNVFTGSYASDEKMARKLAMVVSSTPDDSDISSLIRKLTVLGIFPWKTGVLENMDFNLFHLNLDSLPDSQQLRYEKNR
jgi:hypothetical protein